MRRCAVRCCTRMRAGVVAALDYLERQACFVRRGRNGLTILPAEGFVGATYVHEMARSGDPHLHAHLVIANRVRGEDGRWSAPDMRPVYAHAKTAGTIADAVMRAELSRSLGVEWGPVSNGIAELVAVPTEVREHFSARHAEIMEEATARGLTSMSGIAAIQRETRDRKRVVARDEAVAGWRARAAEHGFGEHELRRALGRARGLTHFRLHRAPSRTRHPHARPGWPHPPELDLHPPRGDPAARRGPSRGRTCRPPRAPGRRLPGRAPASRSRAQTTTRIADTARRSTPPPTCCAPRCA